MIVALLAAMLALNAEARLNQLPRLEMPGTARAVPPPADWLHGWLGLYVTGRHAWLKPVRLRVVQIESGDVSGDPAWELDSTDEPAPIMMFRSLPMLHAGALRPPLALNTPIPFDSPKPLELGRLHWQLAWHCQAAATQPGAPTNSLCQLQLTGGSQTQILEAVERDAFGSPLAGATTVLWAGDLDGDGKPDLLLTTERGDLPPLTTLWLSTQATAGELLHKTADYVPEELC